MCYCILSIRSTSNSPIFVVGNLLTFSANCLAYYNKIHEWKHKEVITIVCKDWAFWSVPIPRLVELDPPTLQWSASLGDNHATSEEFVQLALRCVHYSFVYNNFSHL
jgi:hypothetical protein